MVLGHLSKRVSIQVDWVGVDLCANNLRLSGQDHYVNLGAKIQISVSLFLTVQNGSGTDAASY
jgi:hypothetical protein